MVQNPFEIIEAGLAEVKAELSEIKAALKIPKQELPDRITEIDEACKVIGGENTPVSRAWLYNGTSKGTVPCEHFGGRLVFSRSKLIEWRNSRTSSKLWKDDIVNNSIAASAAKKFR